MIIAVTCSMALSAQLDSAGTSGRTEVRFRHEVGMDATAFLRQFLSQSVSGQPPSTYLSPYFFTYRYKMSWGNLRAGVGAAYANQERDANWYGSLPGETYNNSAWQYDLRLGVEWERSVGKRWQVYYGGDFRPSTFGWDDEWTYSNAGYRNASKTTTTTMAVAGLLGVRFRVTPRLSLMTEGSFSWGVSNTEVIRSSTPQAPEYPVLDNEVSHTTSTSTGYQYPLMVVVAFDL